jgi:hypothetical protein
MNEGVIWMHDDDRKLKIKIFVLGAWQFFWGHSGAWR